MTETPRSRSQPLEAPADSPPGPAGESVGHQSDSLDEAVDLLQRLDGDDMREARCPLCSTSPVEQTETSDGQTASATASAPFAAEENLGPDTTRIWGLDLARLTYAETLEAVDRLIARRRPSYFITANLHYARLTAQDPRLAPVNRQAAFLLADGMPMVWFSRLKGKRLPERVAGSDLICLLAERAAERGHRVFLLGATPEVARAAADTLMRRHERLQIVGIETPMLSKLTAEEHHRLIERIASAGADLLLVAFGQPKGELWLAEHYEQLGVPACVQLGASLDFVAGAIPRAPRWMQRCGLEWLYRTLREPRRMLPRYAADAAFLARAVVRDLRTS